VRTRPPAGSVPDAPGSYQFLDAQGRVLYVGKAKSLRSRLASYFADPATLSARAAQMVAAAERVEWIQVANEVEAILLEYALIKQHRPRFNVRLVDDKSYPYLAVTVSHPWPRASVVRGRKRPGVRYFGPYAHVGAIRDTLDLLLRSFQVRSCADTKLARHERLGRPCLLYHIERCSGPCIGAVGRDRYDRMVEDLMAFLDGHTEEVERRLHDEMEQAAGALDFERAARLRDSLAVLRAACERQQVVTERPEDLDVVGVAEDPLEAAVCVFHVRRGRVVGRRAFVVDKVEDLDTGQLVGRVLEELYAEAPPAGPEAPPGVGQGGSARGERGAGPSRRTATVPRWTSGAGDPEVLAAGTPRQPTLARSVLVPQLPDEAEAWQRLLAARRGGPVELRVPRRGGKRALMETVARNAEEELARHRLRRASDHDSRSRALQALQEALGLPQAPLRIECYDMSHLQGTDYVGSMVVFEDALPRPSEYRRFRLRHVPGNDDYAAMEEVLTRRVGALVAARSEVQDAGGTGSDVAGRRARRFAYPPHLLLLDGGKGQLAVGVRVLERFGLSQEIPVAALAKTFEELYVPGEPDPVRVPRGSDALFLLQRVRDEAHRFAVTYHRSLRGRRMTASVLEGVPGLGPARRARLLREVGSVKALRAASLEQLQGLGWLPDAVARSLYRHLHAPADRAPLRAGDGNGARRPAAGEDGGA
jgi:excinuclease ABC subunit C